MSIRDRNNWEEHAKITMARIRLIAEAAQRVKCDNCPHTQEGHSSDKGCDCSKFTYPYPAMMAAIKAAFAA